MAKEKISIKAIARRERAADKKTRAALAKDKNGSLDSFVNFAQKLGVGADNPLSTSGYGFNPITRVRTTLEWIHRGSWLGGVAIDVVADDMTKMGVELKGKITPKNSEKIEETAVRLGIWNAINENIKWSRLYGGSVAVIVIDGQDFKTPLRLETVDKGQFKGLLVFDRWQVEPSLQNLVTDGDAPDIGLPKFYQILSDAPALRSMTIHYSRVIRLEGIRLPYWQRVQENLWGISVLERLYDRMIAFDSATTGAAQLVYKSYLRTYKIKNMREIAASGGPALAGLVAQVDMMRRFQSIEGITLLDGEDEFEATQHSAFSGLSDALTQFGQQLSGALQIPLVRLFGQSPSGFNSGDTDLRMYYDGIKQQQEKTLRVGVMKVYRAMAAGEGIKLPDGIAIDFKSLWQMTDDQKADVATKHVTAVVQAEEAGLISPKVGMQELQQSSHITGIFSNITDKDINSADDEAVPAAEQAMEQQAELGMGEEGDDEGEGKGGNAKSKPPTGPKKPGKVKPADSVRDSIAAVAALKAYHDVDVVVENTKDSHRFGFDWETILPTAYGYVRRTKGADGAELDCFIGPNPESRNVYVINQRRVNDRAGEFDEHKIMFGYLDCGPALADYFKSYTDGIGWKRIGGVNPMTMDSFKGWMTTADTTQPCGNFLAASPQDFITKDAKAVKDEAPTHHITVNVEGTTIHNAPPGVTVPVNVAPAAVTVKPADVHVAGATVNVPKGDTIINVPKQPAPNVNIEGTTINVPEQKPANVKVDIGETHVHATFPRPDGGNAKKTITSRRGPDGTIVTEIDKGK
jgi:uncharacterized protein